MRRLNLLVATALALSGSSAMAGDKDALSGEVIPPPEEIRFITATKASSSCIGRADTPMCAIESLIGCGQLVPNAGCKKMHYPMGTPQKDRVEYRIVKVGIAGGERLRKLLEDDGEEEPDWGWIRIGDIQARAWVRSCPEDRSDCEGEPWGDVAITIYRNDGIWWWSSSGGYTDADWFVE